VLVSVDGERDTPARLRSYLAPLSADFIGLTGDPKLTAQIAARFAAVFFKEPAGKDGNYNVMHSTQVFAVDKAGRLRATFADASIEDMAKVAALLLEEPG
jgi:protein SCO1/2